MSHVLIISNHEDGHIAAVSKALAESGTAFSLLSPEDIGPDLQLSLELGSTMSPRGHIAASNGESFELATITSVWFRRPRTARSAAQAPTPEAAQFIREEASAAWRGLYAVMENALWVSRPDALEFAAHKTRQLELARHLGLRIPRTLSSNNPSAIKDFYSACSGKVVVKASGPGWVAGDENSPPSFLLTNRLAARDLLSEDALAVVPATFQEEIPKRYEIRANVVGRRVLAIKIDSQKSPVSALDWRRYDVEHTPYRPYYLPPDIEAQCLELARSLGLEFGAIDLIRAIDGEYVFLEINGNGQFLWAEELSGVGVSRAIADLLSGRGAPLHGRD